MREIHNLSNHSDLQYEMLSVEKFINERRIEDASLHFRKALECVVAVFIREYPECKGEDLYNDICNLENSAIDLINRENAKLFHEIRMVSNSSIHFGDDNGEKPSIEEMKDLFHRFEEFLERFCQEYPEPTRKIKNVRNIPTPIIRYSKDEYAKIWGICNLTYRCLGDEVEWYRLVRIDVDKEYIYPTLDGRWHIDSKRMVKDLDKCIRRIELSDRYIPWEKGGGVCIPGFLQSYYGFDQVYMDGLEVVKTDIDWQCVVEEALILFEELVLPNEEMQLESPERMYEDMKKYELRYISVRNPERLKEPLLEKLVMSAKTSPDSDFRWTDYALNISVNDSDIEGNSTICVDENGSIYTYGYKELLHFHGPYEGDIVIRDGVEVLGRGAFDGKDNGVTSFSFPSSLKHIKAGAFSQIFEKAVILPCSIEIVEEGAFNKTMQVYYENDLTHNINSAYEEYLLELEREKERRKQYEQERLEKERLEKERLERERLEKERLETERLEQKRMEIERERILRLARSRKTAGWLAILLGAFGVHNFYLKREGRAVTQLVLTLLCAFSFQFLVCGMWIWAFIEGLMIFLGITNSDGEGIPFKD